VKQGGEEMEQEELLSREQDNGMRGKTCPNSQETSSKLPSVTVDSDSDSFINDQYRHAGFGYLITQGFMSFWREVHVFGKALLVRKLPCYKFRLLKVAFCAKRRIGIKETFILLV